MKRDYISLNVIFRDCNIYALFTICKCFSYSEIEAQFEESFRS